MRRAAIVLVALAVAFSSCRSSREQRIVVGSKNFTEQVILAELLAQQIESRTKLTVERRVNLGGTLICHQAILAGEIDVYVEYTGTALTAVLDLPAAGSPEDIRRRVGQEYSSRFGLTVADALGFENTFALVVRGEDAKRHALRTISDAVPLTAGWRPGFGYEFMERPDGFQGLAKAYGLRFGQPPRIMELGLLYRALVEKQVDIVAGNSTDGVIAALGLVVLEDDRRYFPPYEAVPIVRRQVLDRYPELSAVLRGLAGKITADQIRRLNYAVDSEQRDVPQVAREFLQASRF